MIKNNNTSISSVYDKTTCIGKIMKGIVKVYEALKNLLVSGTPPLTLLKSKGADLVDYKLYGNSVQERLLPREYQQVEFIESTGKQYIDIGYVPTVKSVINVDFKSTKQLGETFTSLFGTQINTDSDNRCYVLFGTDNNIQVNVPRVGNVFAGLHPNGVTKLDNITGAIWIDDRSIYSMDIANKKISIGDNVWDLSNVFPETLGNCEYPLFLLTRNTKGKADANCSKGLVYGFTMYDDNVLVRNMIPCYRKSDNVIGMYDLVEDKFYTNQGTGSFLKGGNVPTPDTPIEVESVGEYDEITGKYKIPVKVSNDTEEITTNIYLDEPLRKIGDYADYIDFEKGKVIRNVQEKTFNGSESWEQGSSMSTRFLLYGINDFKKDVSSNSRINIMSNYFEAISWENRNLITTNSIYTYVASSTTAIAVTNNNTNTVSDFKKWLSVNNVKTYYPLATPIEETIELPNIPTLKGTCILEVDTEIQPSNMEVIYKGKP